MLYQLLIVLLISILSQSNEILKRILNESSWESIENLFDNGLMV